MTYKELERQIQNLNITYQTNFKVVNDGQFISICVNDQNYANFANNASYCVDLWGLGFANLEDNLRHDLLKIAYEFAQTPIDSRHLFPRFYISSKLTPDDDGRFLFKDYDNINSLFWGDRRCDNNTFTQDEIDYIKKKFDTDLSDFIIKEVEE